MYFKQIELAGFKSFADRTLLRLEPGITSIVGPNGCGKSNLLDALRWVLGEQSARELRGAHMQDVIFNGSETRHAAGMAEVSVTFDNADSSLPVDFSEVQVSRRIYRSGESEYLINKAPCRLRDVQELFMDTGVGTHAYSMVGQGKINLILSSKPEDRRYLFEEAAGIIKYKSRKRVAMRKLESAEQNLLRLTDIIAEVQRQMRSLKRQVNAAIRYRELSGQLRELEVRAAYLKFVHLNGEVNRLRGEFATARNLWAETTAQTASLEARHEELGLAKLEIDRLLLTRRESVHDVEAEMERVERQIALLRQQLDFSAEQKDQTSREQESFAQRAAAIDEQIRQTTERAAGLRAEIEHGSVALEAQQGIHAQAAEAATQAEAAVERQRAGAIERMGHRTRTLSEVEALGGAIADVDTQLEALYGRQTAGGGRREELLPLLQEARRREGETQQALTDTEKRREASAEKHNGLLEERQGVEERRQSLRERKSSLDARLTSLRELRDSYEGFAAGVRAVMLAKTKVGKLASKLAGIIGPVGDLLSATENTYERAVEAALGGNINNVIVEDTEAAKEAIQFLKENSAGRVTFLPLDIIRTTRNDDCDAFRSQPGVIGPAVKFVRFDAHIHNAVEYLLWNTLVVETLDDAIHIARQSRNVPRLVTLDGEVVSSAGAVTGGRVRHESRGLLGRSAEIAELEVQVKDADADLSRLAQKRQEIEDSVQALAQDLRVMADVEAAYRRELHAISVDLARHSTELDNLAQASEALERQRDDLCARRAALEEQRRSALLRMDALESDNEALQRGIAQAQEEAARARQALSECASALADLRVQQAALAQRIEEAERDVQREQQARREALAETERRRTQIAQFEQNRIGIENEVQACVEQSRALSEKQSAARVAVVEAENRRQTLLDETDALEKGLRELRERERGVQSEVHRLEMDLRHNEDKITFFQERMVAEYSLALGLLTAEQAGTDDYDEEARDQLVADIRARLQRMGEVNLMAIEEYEGLEKRDTFLSGQAEDLQKAREVLLGVIAKSDKRIRELFMETFEKVAEYFRDFFRRLFNGGQARLYLLDESDPLESGIEIEARPPGKKPETLSLLSGGESAMTAVALLFSIFKAKPSPFCVLDEVDAPLDDANIGRFINMIEEFVAESQFVVITHNKQTMARADALYGVTMQEKGVSQLVSVRFTEKREPAATQEETTASAASAS